MASWSSTPNVPVSAPRRWSPLSVLAGLALAVVVILLMA